MNSRPSLSYTSENASPELREFLEPLSEETRRQLWQELRQRYRLPNTWKLGDPTDSFRSNRE